MFDTCPKCKAKDSGNSPNVAVTFYHCGTYIEFKPHSEPFICRSEICIRREAAALSMEQQLTHPLETLLGLIQEITINRHQRVSFSYEPGSHSLQVDIEGADKTRGRINVSLIHLRAARTPENNFCSNIMEASEYVRKEQREAGGR